MIHLTRGLIRRWLDTLLHIADTPERTAAAFAVGVFFGFSPFLGLHTVLGLACGFLFNLNRVAVLLGVYSNLPWIIGPYYAFVTVTAAALTSYRIPPGFRAQLTSLLDISPVHGEFWYQLALVLKPLLLPYTIGSTIGALIIAAVAYPVALAFVTSRRRIHDIIHHKKPHDS